MNDSRDIYDSREVFFFSHFAHGLLVYESYKLTVALVIEIVLPYAHTPCNQIVEIWRITG
jgi:hypothetical protein